MENESPLKVPKKIVLLIIVGSLFITLTSLLHGMAETWAFEIAKAIITTNGLVIGFFILGATYFARKETASEFYRGFLENEIIKVLESMDKTKKNWKEEFEKEIKHRGYPLGYESPYALGRFTGRMSISIVYLILSIAFSICLFGVNDVAANSSPLKFLFVSILFCAVYFLLVGIYEVVNGIQFIMFKGSEAAALQTSHLIDEIVKERLSKK